MKRLKQGTISESQIRSIVRSELKKSMRPVDKKLYRDLTEAVAQVEKDAKNAEAAVKKATEALRSEMGISGPGIVESWARKIGIVDPCDLRPSQRKQMTDELKLMQKNLDAAKRMDAEAAMRRLDLVGSAAMLGGSASLAFYMYHNPKTTLDRARDMGRKYGQKITDYVAGVDREAMTTNCKNAFAAVAKHGAGATNKVQLMSTLDAIASSNDGLDFAMASTSNADRVSRFENQSLFGDEFSLKGVDPALRDEAMELWELAMGPAKDSEGNPVPVDDSSASFHGKKWKRREVFAIDKPMSAEEMQAQGQVTADQPEGQNPGVWANIKFALRDKKNTKTYGRFAALLNKPGGAEAFKRVGANMVSEWNHSDFGGMYKSPSDFMAHMKTVAMRLGTVFKDEGAAPKWVRSLVGAQPTAYELLYKPSGEGGYGQEVLDLVMGSEGEVSCLPSGKRFDRTTGNIVDKTYDDKQIHLDYDQDGEIDDGEMIDTGDFITYGKYLFILSFAIKIYNGFLRLAPGIACGIKEFAKSIVKSALGVVSVVLDVVKSIIYSVFDILSPSKKNESRGRYTIREQYEIVRRWNNLRTSTRMIESKLCV